MNRTILIVICDFLLVSLLAFSTVDINKVAEEGTERQMQFEIATNQAPAEAGKDLTAVMRLALEDEKKSRDLLLGELERTRQTMVERERQVRTTQQELESKEQQARRLEQELLGRDREAKRLAQDQTSLQAQFAAAQTNIQILNQRLTSTSADALVSKEKLAAMEAELKKRAQEAAAMQAQMANLARSNEVVLAERQKLAGQLQVAEVEKRHAVEQVAKMTEQVQTERQEKAKLVENVKVLANQSGELAREVRENRPLAPNTIFSDFAANRVQARFTAFKSGLIDTNRRRESETVVVSDGTNYVVLCHVGDTPLTLLAPGTEWETLSATLVRGQAQVPGRTIQFHLEDPRLVMVPISAAEAKRLGTKVYRTAGDPTKFQDAVLVGTREPYYGECRFQIDLGTPGYVRLDNNFLKGLFGKFNPSRGDLVFSRTGELLGVMMNGSYCLLIKNLEYGASLKTGNDVREQQPGTLLSILGSKVAGMPFKLQ